MTETNAPMISRKKTAQQPRANSANQQQNKKTNNKQAAQAVSQNQIQKEKVSATETPKPKPSPPPIAQPKPQQQQPLAAREHVPINGFNASDVDVLLSRGIDPQAELYKPEHAQPVKSGSPWGQKAGTMATGKDFWLELRRQVAVLQRGESTNKGG